MLHGHRGKNVMSGEEGIDSIRIGALKELTQGQNTEFPKVYNSVNYSSLQKCKPL